MGLEILSDLSEILPYPIPDFPLYAGIGKLANQNQYTVGCHFHPDFEFNLVLEGVKCSSGNWRRYICQQPKAALQLFPRAYSMQISCNYRFSLTASEGTPCGGTAYGQQNNP